MKVLPELPDPTQNPKLWADIDGPTLLASASVLQLDPANTASLHALRRLAAIAAHLPPNPNARVLSSSKLKSLLSVSGVGDPVTTGFQDPYEGLLVVEVPYFDGPQLAMQGLSTHCGKVAEFLLTAIELAPDGLLPATFFLKVRALAKLLLSVSHRACERAGLDRWTVPGPDGARVRVPSAGVLAERRTWVQFDEEDLFNGLPDRAREYLTTALVREQGTGIPAVAEDPAEWSMVQPLVRSGETLIVQSPPDLTAALRHHIVRAAVEEHCLPELVQVMLAYATYQAKDLLAGLVDEPFQQIEEGLNWVRMQAAFDADKVMDLFVVVDDLESYNVSSAYGTWEATAVMEELIGKSLSGDRVLRVFMPSVIGRDLAVGVNEPGVLTPTLIAGREDLNTILQTPDLTDLDLWYFANAVMELNERSHVLAFSVVDLFELYREHRMSFYLTDEERPGHINVAVGHGQELRYANAFRHDQHCLIKYDGKGWVEATAMHGRGSSPVYAARGSQGAVYAVDLDDVVVWIRVAPTRDQGARVDVHTLLLFAEATAYWIWQLWLAAPDLIRRSSTAFGTLTVTVRGAGSVSSENCVRVRRRDGALILDVAVPTMVPDPLSPENYIDRDLVEGLHNGLGGSDPGIVDVVAPPGPKGIIHFTNAAATTAWAPSATRAWRGSEAVEAQVLDDLGDHLTTELEKPLGALTDDQRIETLTRDVTPWLIDRFRDELAELERTGLIEALAERCEALIAYYSRESERLPAQIACFGEADDQVQLLQRQLASASDTMMTSRFLVELAAAFPPNGSHPLTQERYDRLLALGAEIINKGMLVDSLRSGVADVELSILASGRLGTAREGDAYAQAIGMFSHLRAQAVLADAITPSPHRREDFDLEVADSLASETFGFTYTDLFTLARVLDDQCGNEQTLRIATTALIQTVVQATGWDEGRVTTIVAALSLSEFGGSFSQFWDRLPDVAPWRFNRDRSYLKRPLIREGDHVVIGRRVLRHAPMYWLDSFRTGRLQAKGKMATAMNERRAAKGRAFEREVAVLLEELGFGPVRERLRRVGDYDFRKLDGKNLGDIDVAAVRPDARELLLVEAKNLEYARTPAELRNEVDQLVGQGNSAVRRLRERANWVRRHLKAVLAEFGVEDPSGWSVKAVVVVKQSLLSEHLNLSTDIPVIGIERLGIHLAVPSRRH